MNNVPTPSACAGPCANNWRRAEAKRLADEIPHDLTPWPGNPYWCDRCRTRVLDALNMLPELVAAAHGEALHATPKQAERVSRTTAPAWPGQAARMLTDLVIGGLVEFEDDMRELRYWSQRTATFEPIMFNRTVTVLTRSIDWFLTDHPIAADPDCSPGATILRWKNKAMKFTGRDELIREYPVRCPTCDLLGLRREDGSSYIECWPRIGGCGRLWTEDEYERLAVVVAADLKKAA